MNSEQKPKIVFFGTFEYAAHALKTLIEAGYLIIAVVTNPDSLQGRKKILTPAPVKIAAQKLGLPVFQPEKIKSSLGFIETLKRLNANLGIVVAYSRIIPKEMLEIFPNGMLNIHPSLLPAYRGPSPVQTTILNGEKETGVTIMQIDEEVDHGPILSQAKYQIPPDAYCPQITHELFELGVELLIQTIPDWISGQVNLKQQDHSKATFTKKFTREDGKIDWNRPAEKIYNQIRALNPEPGAWTTCHGKILKILKAKLESGKILPEEVQLEGKKKMPFADFLRGFGKKEIDFT